MILPRCLFIGPLLFATMVFGDTRLPPLRTKVIAGVTVADTAVVRAGLDYVRAHSDPQTYNHVVRCWLYTTIIMNKLESTYGKFDPEMVAIATLFHDLGLDPTGELRSPDKRFEVDGGIATRNWIMAEKKKGNLRDWNEQRIQLVWDAIVLHTEIKIAPFKEPLVKLVSASVAIDFHGPDSDLTGQITWDEFWRINDEFKRGNFAEGVKLTMTHLAETKPESTYDNFAMQFGVRFVQNFTANMQGKLGFEMALTAIPDREPPK